MKKTVPKKNCISSGKSILKNRGKPCLIKKCSGNMLRPKNNDLEKLHIEIFDLENKISIELY